ncbi:hypothetical protein E4T56_gene5711, partial [Termitomyces sp. T112]
PFEEAASIQSLLRELREQMWRAQPELGLWSRMSFGLYADGRIMPCFDYEARPAIDGEPAKLSEAKADLARAPRPERWWSGRHARASTFFMPRAKAWMAGTSPAMTPWKHQGPTSKPCDAAVQIVLVGAPDLRGDDLADLQRPAARQIHSAVDLRRIGPGATLGHGRPDLVDDDLLARADLALEAAGRDLLLPGHQRIVARLLDLLRHRVLDRV